MKIEVTVEGQEPVVHKLTKDKTLLGAGQDCDIPVEADGISRKHLMIIAENDQYFAVDQGSTNGSFINEERMVPGQRTSFTSFFPLKMGFYVTVALLSDDEGAGESFDFAKSLSKTAEPVKSSKAPPTQTNIQAPRGGGAQGPKLTLATNEKSKKERPSEKTKSSSEEQKSSQNMKLAAVLVAILGTAGLWYLTKAPEAVPEQTENTPAVAQPQVNIDSFDFSFAEVAGVDAIANMVSDQKCTEAFKQICERMGIPKEGHTLAGITSTPSAVVMVLPALSFDEMVTEFSTALKWTPEMISSMQPNFEMRDLIGLYISRIDGESWNGLALDVPTLAVIFVDKNGTRTGDVWVADLKAMVKASLTPDFMAATKLSIEQGVSGVAHLTGFFRKAEL